MKNSKLFSLKIFDCHSRNDLVKEFLNRKIQNFFHETNFFWIIFIWTQNWFSSYYTVLQNINIHELFHSVTFFGEKNYLKKKF